MNTGVTSQLERELREQGAVLAGRTEPGREGAAAAADVLRRDDVDFLLIAARGTSDNAARYAQYLLGSELRLTVGLAAPWLYSSEQPPLLRRGAALAISQSGRSPDIVRVLEAAREQGRPAIALTNELESPLARAADLVVPLFAGPERSVAATKTYLATLHAIAQIVACLRPDPARDGWFERLPGLVTECVARQLDDRARFDPLAGVSLLTVAGRGLQFPTAYETALKVREMSGIAAEAFSPPDLIHGPIAALSASGAVWVLSSSGRSQPDFAAFEALTRGAGIHVAVSDDDEVLDAADISVRLPGGLPEWVAPMLAVIPGQVAALRLGELRHVDLDHPHGLSKVTLTR